MHCRWDQNKNKRNKNVFFDKNYQLLANSKTFKIFFFFLPTHINKFRTSFYQSEVFNQFWRVMCIFGSVGHFVAFEKKQIVFFKKIWIFCIGIYWKKVFLLFRAFGKICHFKKKWIFYPICLYDHTPQIWYNMTQNETNILFETFWRGIGQLGVETNSWRLLKNIFRKRKKINFLAERCSAFVFLLDMYKKYKVCVLEIRCRLLGRKMSKLKLLPNFNFWFDNFLNISIKINLSKFFKYYKN
jgi:hypothetical protein